MTRKLFLASSFSDSAQYLTELAPNLKGKKVTFIPTASDVEDDNFFVNLGKEKLQELGLIIDELNLAVVTPAMAAAIIKKNDLIYISGGNTFYLLQELKRTGADQVIRTEVEKGKLYLGESAGAAVASPDITYLGQMDDAKLAPKLQDNRALNLVDFYPLPHYLSELFAEITPQISAKYASKIPLKPINNNQAILVNGEQIMIKGK